MNLNLKKANTAIGRFVTGSALVQLIPLLSAPLLSRIFLPEDFGVYAIYISIVTILGTLIGLSLHNAILIEKEETEISNITIGVIIICCVSTFFLYLFIFIVPDELFVFGLGKELISYIKILPISALFSSFYLVIYTWVVSQANYDILTKSKVILGVSTVGFQFLLGLLGMNALGFIIAHLIGMLLATLYLAKVFISSVKVDINISNILNILKRYKSFIIYSVPANFINTFSNQLPEFVINKLFGSNALGQYSLANRVFRVPLSFISVSIQDIFRQKASKEIKENGNAKQIFNKFFILLVLISLFLLIPVIFLIPYVFPIIFGNQWVESGYLIKSIGFLLIVRFISSPLSYIWILKEKQKIDFIWQLGLLIISLLTFYLVYNANPNISLNWFLIYFSSIVGLWYIVCIAISYKFSR